MGLITTIMPDRMTYAGYWVITVEGLAFLYTIQEKGDGDDD